MARNIKISVLGPAPCTFSAGEPFHDLTKQMKHHWEKELSQVLCEKPDLIVLPEACDQYTGLDTQRKMEYYQQRGDQMRDFFAEVCRRNRCNLAYSAIRQTNDGSWRNSTQLLDRCGNVAGIYNKNHLLEAEIQDDQLLCGREAPVFELDIGRAACVICFDLNFEELRRQYETQHPELILFSSMYHGGMVQREWAYHCRSYFVGAVAGLPCGIINPLGETAAKSTNYHHFVTAVVNLDYRILHLDGNWEKLSAAHMKYGSAIQITDPGLLGSVMLTSESEEFSAGDIVREFNMELLDDYFARSRQNRQEHMEPNVH